MRFDLFVIPRRALRARSLGFLDGGTDGGQLNTQIPLSLRSFGMTKENTNFFIDT